LTEYPNLEIHTASDASGAAANIGNVAALFGFGTSIDDGLISRAQKLEWLQFLSSGTDTLSRLGSLKPRVIVTSTHGVHGPSVSEMVFLHMLTLARDYARLRRNQSQAKWEEFDQILLFKKTVAILGTGLIASELAQRCKSFGMTVLGVSRTPREMKHFDGMFHRSQLREAAGRADFLVILVPLTPETTGMVNADVLGSMRPSAYLINVGRGAICDEEALTAALLERRIAGAGLDAFCVEPLPPEHLFWKMENVMITPHIAGRNDCYAELVMPILTHNLACFINGRSGDMINVVKRSAADGRTPV
jgi:phosphoglycerate dehydrogenase-like enzyme